MSHLSCSSLSPVKRQVQMMYCWQTWDSELVTLLSRDYGKYLPKGESTDVNRLASVNNTIGRRSRSLSKL